MSPRFDDERLGAAYRKARGGAAAHGAHGAHGATCPDPAALLAAARGEGDEAARLGVLDAALRCAACRRELALLHAVAEPPPRATVGHNVWAGAWRRPGALAVAASALLVAGLVGVGRWRARLDGEVLRAVPGEPVLVAPASGAPLGADGVAFVWRRVPHAFAYVLEVDAADGTLLLTASTADTTRVVARGGLRPGELRWSVRARLDDGTERASESRPLRVR